MAKRIKDAFLNFLHFDAGAAVRHMPSQKVRKYDDVKVRESFQAMEKQRIAERQALLEKRHQLQTALQDSTSQKAAITQGKSSVGMELSLQGLKMAEVLTLLETNLKKTQVELEATEAKYMVVEGYMKLIVLNKITHMKHMSQHPSGIVYTPETMAVIENIHYCANNNLPVERYKLYEAMPEIFFSEIGEMEAATRRLIEEKHSQGMLINQDNAFALKPFGVPMRMDEQVYQISLLHTERSELCLRMNLLLQKKLEKWEGFLERVVAQETPFTSIDQLVYCCLSTKLKLNFNQEERAFIKDLIEAYEIKAKWLQYEGELVQRLHKIQFSYCKPPPYIKNHPVLLAKYNETMEKFMTPLDFSDLGLIEDAPPGDHGGVILEQMLRDKIDKAGFDERFEKLFNTERNKLIAQKKQLELQFHKMSARVMDEYSDVLAEKFPVPNEEFTPLPKPKANPEDYMRMTDQEISKILYLNNKNPSKYTVDYFAQYFGLEGLDKQSFARVLKLISFMRITQAKGEQNPEEKEAKQFDTELLKFKFLNPI